MGVYMTHNYSYYTDTCEGVIAMIKLLTNRYVKISMCLVKYECLPSDSDNISYDMLKGGDIRSNSGVGLGPNEIVGFDYNSSQKPMPDIELFLNVLVNVYNDY